MVHRPADRPPPATAGPGAARVYLDVAYVDKDAAKALGARWDPTARRWYDPRPSSPELERWAARVEVPELLPGEDRAFGAGLFVDLVPRSCWFTNVRSCVSPADWERLRRPVLRRAGHRCEVCGDGEDRTVQRWLEVHERWHYDQRAGVQALRRLICPCSPCHLVTHFGYANVTGRTEQAFAHLRRVTGMNDVQARAHVHAGGSLWIERSARSWSLDLGMLTDAGITVHRPGPPDERRVVADRTLAPHTGVRDGWPAAAITPPRRGADR